MGCNGARIQCARKLKNERDSRDFSRQISRKEAPRNLPICHARISHRNIRLDIYSPCFWLKGQKTVLFRCGEGNCAAADEKPLSFASGVIEPHSSVILLLAVHASSFSHLNYRFDGTDGRQLNIDREEKRIIQHSHSLSLSLWDIVSVWYSTNFVEVTQSKHIRAATKIDCHKPANFLREREKSYLRFCQILHYNVRLLYFFLA